MFQRAANSVWGIFQNKIILHVNDEKRVFFVSHSLLDFIPKLHIWFFGGKDRCGADAKDDGQKNLLTHKTPPFEILILFIIPNYHLWSRALPLLLFS
jgi:hypothetical protein